MENENISQKSLGKIVVIWGIGLILLLGICILLIMRAREIAMTAAEEIYAARVDAMSENTAQSYYDRAFDKAEKEYHVSNRVGISLGTIQEQAKLEVLEVSDVEYIVHNEDEEKVKRWLEIPGRGLFTVDMRESEFLIDEIHQTVIARLPVPRLTFDEVDYENIEVFDLDAGIIRNGSYEEGVNKGEEDIKKGHEMITNGFLSNQEYLQSAESAAECIITELVQNLNPRVKNLQVIVEFVD